MNISLISLKLLCQRGDELIQFGEKISFFHGEMSTGKSTIVELINYCLGGKLVRTPAVTAELVSVQLLINIGGTALLLERAVPSSNSVDATWQDGVAFERLSLPLVASEQPIEGDDVFNLSDFLLKRMGIVPIKVKTKKLDPESDYHRLSFRDFFKFCYLDQPNLDSSFFVLEVPVRKEKSKDVLKYILGFQSERLIVLQQELAELRQQQRGLRDAASQIDEFLAEYGYNSEQDIDAQIDRVNSDAEALETERDSQLEMSDLGGAVIDEDRIEARTLREVYQAKLEAISDIKARIDEQQSLSAELISLKLKAARNSSATEILDRAGFQSCPECGSAIEAPTSKDQCRLCKTHLIEREEDYHASTAIIEQDLNDRISDLKSSLVRLRRSSDYQQKSAERVKAQWEIVQSRIDRSRKSIESEYIQRARKIESSLGALDERRRQLVRVKAMPAEIERRRAKADQLSESIARTQRNIESETSKFEQGRVHLASLEKNFLGLLRAIHFPEISENDQIHVNPVTWIPSVYPDGNEARAWTFFDAGSGGKMVLFKTCFALALHKTVAEFDLFLPRLFIVDSTMKNITPDINRDVFEHFYRELYRLLSDELAEWQCIVVDQTFFPFEEGMRGAFQRELTKEDPTKPPLISYYHGH